MTRDQKDRDFVRTLLAEGLIDHQILLDRVAALNVDAGYRERLTTWVSVTAGEL